MATQDQKKDAERLERYIEREQLVSSMNDTKWRELEAAMASVAPHPPRYRVKCLRSPEPSQESWEHDWRTHVPTYKAIEWLDIDPILRERRGHLLKDSETDRTDELVDLLRKHSIPFEQSPPHIRVYGYRRGAG